MTQPLTDAAEAYGGVPVADGWDVGVDEGDGGDYDRALDAYDRGVVAEEPLPPVPLEVASDG